ncbi:aminotransferase class V-fold PLP-dependent enzyme [Saccharospirillum mangrovi]|uniref:aminotransferase class V-fold PLP-dependent enzyme n=1 Tax=Saccharospirillum mangrovi TaxID=2161747 RepID=UPI000D34DD20|nr:aminotransferase class V-fold PLP-dependent enzyme [Saccharospirillum mangrovi]
MSQSPIYFDYAATTPVDERVAAKMVQFLTREGQYGNPASRSHLLGWLAEEAVEDARNEIADLIGADNREIVWTSGATESNNLALKGVAENFAPDDCHLIVSATEHKAVLDPALYLQKRGYGLTILKPDSDGVISVDAVKNALQPNTRLVSLMAANNETGVLNPVAKIGALLAERGVWFHIDAAQAVGKIPVDVNEWQATLLSISGHKFYAPKGVGALYVRRRSTLELRAQIHGGGHERGMRSGTLATHQLVAIGAAANIAKTEMADEAARIQTLRDRLWSGIEDLGDIRINGAGAPRTPGHLNVAFGGIDGEALMMALRNLAVSTGSACTSASVEPSHVLKAMGLADSVAHGSLRFSLGRYTTQSDVDQAIASIREAVPALRKQSSVAS